MPDRLNAEEMARVLQSAIQQGHITEEDSAVFFHDLDFLKKRIAHIQKCFGAPLFQTVAIKANPLPRLMEFLLTCHVGAEAATMSEAYIAQKCGYPAGHILFDSPAKTKQELQAALSAGMHINVDSFTELERIAEMRKTIHSSSRIGLRINPQVGDGTIGITSVSGIYSKFAIPLNEFYSKLKETYHTYPWLNGIHVHVGSQGCSLEQLVEGVQQTVKFTESLQRPLQWMDIGGGIPATYRSDRPSFGVQNYARALKKRCPQLFDGHLQIYSEFGRYTHANAGWLASRVEYVKRQSGKTTIMTHVGADLLMRRCYLPDQWHHDFSVCDANGNLKEAPPAEKVTIAGPLCFGGDILARDIELPVMEEGDYLLIHDAGAYTMSMASRHTSRQIPAALGYMGTPLTFQLLKKRESLEDVFRFWE